MCRAPVTFGGGMTMQNGLRLGSGSAVEVAALVPELQPALLGFLGVVLLGKFGRHRVAVLVTKKTGNQLPSGGHAQGAAGFGGPPLL